MTTWHDRLQTALTARKKDWADLIKPTGKTKPSVYAWKPTANARATTMNAENAALVCEFLRINVLWLFLGRGPSGLEEGEEYEKKSTAAVANKKLMIAAEPEPHEYHLSTAELTLIEGYKLAGEETREILLQAAQSVIDRFSERSEKKT